MANRRPNGQATVEYVAVIGLVALVLAVGAAVVTVTGVGDRLLYAMRQGLCAVGGVIHYLMIVKAITPTQIAFAVVLALLLGARVVFNLMKPKAKIQPRPAAQS